MARENPLNKEEARAIELYCDEEGKCFLNKYASYEKAYFTERDKTPYASWQQACRKFFKKAKVQKAIRESMGKVGYDNFFIRNEYREMYDQAKADGNTALALKYLDSMAKTEAMFNNKVDETTNDAEKIDNARKAWLKFKEQKGIETKKDPMSKAE